jgi:hypothetical protein
VGHVRDAEKIYRDGRNKVLTELAEPSQFTLDLKSSILGDKLEGTLEISGPDDASAVVQIVLAERGVLYPGKSKVVIQRMVARAGLTKVLGGVSFKPEQGKMTLPFSRSLQSITESNIEYLKALEADGAGSVQTFAARMDPAQLTIVAFVRDRKSGRILQAVQIDPTLPEDDR